jgi:hypothetical protein
MTELAAPQISSLMEALPGIAAVLRSPVANAIVSLSRAAAGLEDFRPAEAEELLRFGVRRNLLTQDEVDRILAEIREAVSRRPAKPGVPVAEKPKKAPTPPAPISEHRTPLSAMLKATIPSAPVRVVPKPPPKPAAKVPAKPAARASAKAPQVSKHKPVEKKKAAKPATKKPVAKATTKKSAAKKGHR